MHCFLSMYHFLFMLHIFLFPYFFSSMFISSLSSSFFSSVLPIRLNFFGSACLFIYFFSSPCLPSFLSLLIFFYISFCQYLSPIFSSLILLRSFQPFSFMYDHIFRILVFLPILLLFSTESFSFSSLFFLAPVASSCVIL
jgi:hypothetical protein